jgi:hypothetical protein
MAADCKSAALRSYGGSNPPLCTRNFEEISQLGGMSRTRRKWIALALLAALAGLAWTTMEPGRVRLVVFVLIGSFALRIVLTTTGSRYDEKQG